MTNICKTCNVNCGDPVPHDMNACRDDHWLITIESPFCPYKHNGGCVLLSDGDKSLIDQALPECSKKNCQRKIECDHQLPHKDVQKETSPISILDTKLLEETLEYHKLTVIGDEMDWMPLCSKIDCDHCPVDHICDVWRFKMDKGVHTAASKIYIISEFEKALKIKSQN